MEIEIKELNGVLISEVVDDNLVIRNESDAVDVIGNSNYQGSSRIILLEEQLHPDFFDLKTKVAGDILQKFSTYNSYLAIVGDFSKYESKSLRDFIYESNKVGRVNFVNTVEEAREKLSKKQ
jgi:hypothetical protein